MDSVKKTIIDHYRNPRNFKKLTNFTGNAKSENLSCGDKIEVWIEKADDGRIIDAGFNGEGCSLCIASCSILLQDAIKKGVIEDEISAKNFVDQRKWEISPTRLKCVEVSVDAFNKANK